MNIWYPMNSDHVNLNFSSDGSVNGDGFEIGFRCISGDGRPYPPPTDAPPMEDTQVHVAVLQVVAEGFRMIGRLFNFLSSVSDS